MGDQEELTKVGVLGLLILSFIHCVCSGKSLELVHCGFLPRKNGVILPLYFIRLMCTKRQEPSQEGCRVRHVLCYHPSALKMPPSSAFCLKVCV